MYAKSVARKVQIWRTFHLSKIGAVYPCWTEIRYMDAKQIGALCLPQSSWFTQLSSSRWPPMAWCQRAPSCQGQGELLNAMKGGNVMHYKNANARTPGEQLATEKQFSFMLENGLWDGEWPCSKTKASQIIGDFIAQRNYEERLRRAGFKVPYRRPPEPQWLPAPGFGPRPPGSAAPPPNTNRPRKKPARSYPLAGSISPPAASERRSEPE